MSARRQGPHPRGEPTWPDWKEAEPGTRVERVGSGRTGTFVKVGNRHPGLRTNTFAVIDWDPHGRFGVQRGRVDAPAFDLRVICQVPVAPRD